MSVPPTSYRDARRPTAETGTFATLLWPWDPEGSSLVDMPCVPGAWDHVTLTKGLATGALGRTVSAVHRGRGSWRQRPDTSKKWSRMKTQGTEAWGSLVAMLRARCREGPTPPATTGAADPDLRPRCNDHTVSTPAAGSKSALPHD